MADSTEPPEPWTHRTLQNWARKRFPRDFETLSSHSILVFKDRKRTELYLGSDLNKLDWPENTSTKIVKVGTYKGGPKNEENNVYAFVYGAKSNRLSYVIESSAAGGYEKLTIENHFWCIKFDGQFSHLGNRDNSTTGTTHARFRALILYYYVAAGNLVKVEPYSGFLKEFWGACAWINNGGNRPSLADGPFRNKSENAKSSATSKSEEKQPGMKGNEQKPKKRMHDAEPNDQQGKSTHPD
jgi:hypothetical protein